MIYVGGITFEFRSINYIKVTITFIYVKGHTLQMIGKGGRKGTVDRTVNCIGISN